MGLQAAIKGVCVVVVVAGGGGGGGGGSYIDLLFCVEVVDLVVEVEQGFWRETGHDVISEDDAVREISGLLCQPAVHASRSRKSIHLQVLQ